MNVDDLLRGGDGDRLARRLLQRHRDFGAFADEQRDFLRFDRREAFEREAQLITARLQRQEACDAGSVGDGRRFVAGFGPRERDGDAGKCGFRLIESHGFDGAFVDLGEGVDGDEKHGQREERQQRTAVQHRSLRFTD